MSFEAMLEIDLSQRTSELSEIVSMLGKAGWSCIDPQGLVEYLPLGDNGDFNWQSARLSEDEVLQLIVAKQKSGETVGLNLYHKNMTQGFSLLAKDAKSVLLSLCINRRTISQNDASTDVGWYFENIVQKLREEICPECGYKFCEYWG